MNRFTTEQLRQYFDRIRYSGGTAPTLENLEALHRCHLLCVPYENLDILNGVPLDLHSEALFEKLIVHRRGGYCFELQGLFCALLQSLGYAVTQYAGRFMDEPGVTQMRRHRVLVVELDGRRYVCDVGVRSESPRRPLELAEGLVQADGISQYRYRKDPFYGWVLCQKEPGKDWKPLLGFTEEAQTDDDFVMPSFYCEKHPESTFNKYMKVSLFTPDSDLTIVGNTFKVYRGGRVVERRTLGTEAEAARLLAERFGIRVPAHFHRFLYPAEPDAAGREENAPANMGQVIVKMAALSQGNLHDINHFLKVYAYARAIAVAEGLSAREQQIVEIAAVIHDIACPLCREKYGDTNGKHQEAEGAVLARAFLDDLRLPPEAAQRVVYLVAHHHTPQGVDGADYQILLEADYLVNADEAGYDRANRQNALARLFRTETGKALLRAVYPAPPDV